MSESEVEPTELWTPPEKLNANVGKMAWHLFLKWWDAAVARDPDMATMFRDDDAIKGYVEKHYRVCIHAAKALEEINQDPGK